MRLDSGIPTTETCTWDFVVEFNAKPNQPLYIRCRGGEIAFLTKAEAMKGLATMKYDMPKAAH